MKSAARHPFVLTLILTSTVLGIAGTDLVLPAVPTLPALLAGTIEQSQLVIAAFTAGAAAGLLMFGELGARLDQRRLLAGSLLGYGILSALCSLSPSLHALIWLRFFQGAAGSAAAVFAPGMLRALYSDEHAVGALGFLGSVESLTPALAPIAGYRLLEAFGWTASFNVLGVLGVVLAAVVWLVRERLPNPAAQSRLAPAARAVPMVNPTSAPLPGRSTGNYARLLTNWLFLQQALSQAFTLGALLVFVFGAPTVITNALHGTLNDFILLQLSGISMFIIAANAVGKLSRRFGPRNMIMAGTVLSAVGALMMFAYALLGGENVLAVITLFVPINIGLGLRGPPGFHAALVATDGDDSRGAAIVVVAILLTTALGTAAAAPLIGRGLITIATAAAVLSSASVLILNVGYARHANSTDRSASDP